MTALQGDLKSGCDHFNAFRYFEAHEYWENAWRKIAESEARSELKGAIQVCGVLVLLERGRGDAARRLAGSALALGGARKGLVSIEGAAVWLAGLTARSHSASDCARQLHEGRVLKATLKVA